MTSTTTTTTSLMSILMRFRALGTDSRLHFDDRVLVLGRRSGILKIVVEGFSDLGNDVGRELLTLRREGDVEVDDEVTSLATTSLGDGHTFTMNNPSVTGIDNLTRVDLDDDCSTIEVSEGEFETSQGFSESDGVVEEKMLTSTTESVMSLLFEEDENITRGRDSGNLITFTL